MIKLSKRFSRSTSKLAAAGGTTTNVGGTTTNVGGSEIKWEVRPGGMLVQKRDTNQNQNHSDETTKITIRVSNVSQSHDVSIQSTSTFGELKIVVSLLTKLEPEEQRLLFKGKEREDDEHLHMVGVRDKDKVVMLQDPRPIKDKKIKKKKKLLDSLPLNQPIGNAAYRTITV